MADENVSLGVSVTGGAASSAELKKVERAVDALGDEARETAAEIALLEAKLQANKAKLQEQRGALMETVAELQNLNAEAKAGKGDQRELAAAIHHTEQRLLKEEAALKKTERAVRKLSAALDEATASSDKFSGSVEDAGDQAVVAERKLQNLWASIRSGDAPTKRTTKSLLSFGRVMKFLWFGVKWGAIALGVQVLTTAVYGLGAASYAAIAGLGPLVNLWVAAPAALAAVAQAFVALKVGTMGMGEAFKAMADPEADPEKIKAAQEGLHKNQIKLLEAVIDTGEAWAKVRKRVGGALFDGLDETYSNLSSTYMPIVSKYLTQQAKSMNSIAKDAAGWLNSTEGQTEMSTLMGNSVKNSDRLFRSTGNLTKTLVMLTNSAQPMMDDLTGDLLRGTGNLETYVRENRDHLEQLFIDSYDFAERFGQTVADFTVGLINIGKESDAMTSLLGNGLEDMGRTFRAWTESREGRREIRQWFRDMVPVVKELGKWVEDLGAAANDISMSPEDFVEVSSELRKALPVLADVIENFGERAWKVYEDLKEAGVVGGAWKALTLFGRAVERSADLLSKLPSDVKKTIAFATGLYAAYRILKGIGRITGLASLASMLTGGRIGGKGSKTGTMNVTAGVVNVMGPGGTGGSGGKGGKGGRGPTVFGGPGNLIRFGVPAALVTFADDVSGGITNWLGNKLDLNLTNTAFDKDPMSEESISQMESDLGNLAKGWGHKLADEAATGFGLFGDSVVDKAKENVQKYENAFLDMINAGGVDRVEEIIAAVAESAGVSVQTILDLLPVVDNAIARVHRTRETLEGLFGDPADIPGAGPTTPFKGGPRDVPKGPKLQPGVEGLMEGIGGGPTVTPKVKLGPAMQDLHSFYAMLSTMPPKVTTQIMTKGLPDSLAGVEKLTKQYDLTPKQIQTLMRLMGVPASIADARRIRNAVTDVPENRNTQFGTDGAPQAAAAAARVAAAIARIDENVQVNVGANIDPRLARLGVPLFTGGATKYGERYLVGEMGPEAWIGPAGQMKLLGARGPEVRTDLGAGAVIPASGTADPFGGSMGNAPEWAQSAYRDAYKAAVKAVPTSAHSESDSSRLSISMDNWQVGDNVDEGNLKRAVTRAVLDALREQEERR